MRKNQNNNYSNSYNSGKVYNNNNKKKNHKNYINFNNSSGYNKFYNYNNFYYHYDPFKLHQKAYNHKHYQDDPLYYDNFRYENQDYFQSHFYSAKTFKNEEFQRDFYGEGSEYKKTYLNSKNCQNSINENSYAITKNFFSPGLLNLSNKLNDESEIIKDDPLFEEIRNKLNNDEYKQRQEELIKDMNALINKRAFIKAFNDYSFLSTEYFEIFNELESTKIYLSLNLINFINIINAIFKYTDEDPKQLAVILNKMGINFSWIKYLGNTVRIVLLTPKSSILYNYLSTHGIFGIENKEYKEKVKEFLLSEDKNTFDFGFCYEDISTSHLIEVMGENNFQLVPNVMYYVKENLAEKLIKLNLVDITKPYKIKKVPHKYGYNETDLIISMKENVEIESNFNFRTITIGDIKFDKNKITLEKGVNYLFEMKTSVWLIEDRIQQIENAQSKFINALKNVKIIDENPYSKKAFKSILMCDNNSLISDKVANNTNSVIKNKTLIYSGFQVGITFVNRLNNNLKALYKEIDRLKENNSKLIEELDELKIENSRFKGKVNFLNGEND